MKSTLCLLGLIGCTKATLQGTVTDPLGAPIVAAQVAITGTTFSTLTDATGHFSVPFVPGLFSMTVTKDGYLGVQHAYLTTQPMTLPLAPIAFYPVAPGAALSWLDAGKADAVSPADSVTNLLSGKIGFNRLPDLQIPSDVWGFVYAPHTEDRSARGSSLLAGLSTSAGDAPEIALYRVVWNGQGSSRGWQNGLPTAMWVADQVVDADILPSDSQMPAGWIIRPRSSLDDGVYAMVAQGSMPATGRLWPFKVGNVAQPQVQQGETEGD